MVKLKSIHKGQKLDKSLKYNMFLVQLLYLSESEFQGIGQTALMHRLINAFVPMQQNQVFS